MTVEFDGVPYSDTFRVEVRWVASRLASGQVEIGVGLEVDFQKQTFLKSKIRSATIEETISVHQDLYEAVKIACGKEGVDDDDEDCQPQTPKAIKTTSKYSFGTNLQLAGAIVVGIGIVVVGISWALRSSPQRVTTNDLALKIDRLETELASMKAMLLEINTLLQSQQTCSN